VTEAELYQALIVAIPSLITGFFGWILARRKNETEAVKSLVEVATGSLVEKTSKDNDRLRKDKTHLETSVMEKELRIGELESLNTNYEIGFDTNVLLLQKKCGVDPIITKHEVMTEKRDYLKRKYLGISNS
jgi:Flp pilus assembly protein TadB